MKRDDAGVADELSADLDFACSLFLLALCPLAPAGEKKKKTFSKK